METASSRPLVVEALGLGDAGDRVGWRVFHDPDYPEEHDGLDVFVWEEDGLVHLTQGGSILHDDVDLILMPPKQAAALLVPLIKAVTDAS